MQIQDDDLMRINYDSGGKKWMVARNMEMARGPGSYPSLEVEYNHVGVFTFLVQSPEGMTFAAHNPFVPKLGKPNPPDFADQFVVTGAGTNMLVVRSANANQAGGQYNGGTYHYELRFSNGSKLDPIITNNGCCRGFMLSNYLEPMAVGIALLIAAYFFFIRPWRMRRAAAPNPGASPPPRAKDADEL
jgi:hypothetical protein